MAAFRSPGGLGGSGTVWMMVAGCAVLAGCLDASRRSFAEACADGDAAAVVAANVGPGVWAAERRSARWRELWRVAGTSEAQHLAMPTWLSVSREGRLAIPDFQLLETIVVDPDGTWRGPIGRKGSGPGELASAVAAGWSREGELQVLDVSGSKLEVYDPRGESVRTQSVERSFLIPVFDAGEVGWAAVGDDGSVYLQGGIRLDPEAASAATGRAPILRLALGAAVPDTVLDHPFPVLRPPGWAPLPAPGWAFPRAAVGANGRVAMSDPAGRYRIRILRDGDPDLVVCRDAPPLAPRVEAYASDAAGSPEADVGRAAREAPRPNPPVAHGALLLAADGRLWVSRTMPAFTDGHLGPPGAAWDVFAIDGRYLGEVRAPDRARFQAAVGDTLYVVEIGELDEAWIVAYQLELQ